VFHRPWGGDEGGGTLPEENGTKDCLNRLEEYLQVEHKKAENTGGPQRSQRLCQKEYAMLTSGGANERKSRPVKSIMGGRGRGREEVKFPGVKDGGGIRRSEAQA